MFDLAATFPSPHDARVTAVAARPGHDLRLGSGRAVAAGALSHWLAATLDEVDYGMLLLDEGARVVHRNQTARTEMNARHPLQLVGDVLRTLRPQDGAALQAALQGANRRGLRRLLTLGDGVERVGISVVPLGSAAEAAEAFATLLILGKRQLCEELSVESYARTQGLTPAETRVLAALCKGQSPGAVAAAAGVAISTVRTHIGTIRTKTGAPSIRALVHQVSVLPPLMKVLRGVPSGATAESAT